jgi:hypothetical protein
MKRNGVLIRGSGKVRKGTGWERIEALEWARTSGRGEVSEEKRRGKVRLTFVGCTWPEIREADGVCPVVLGKKV